MFVFQVSYPVHRRLQSPKETANCETFMKLLFPRWPNSPSISEDIEVHCNSVEITSNAVTVTWEMISKNVPAMEAVEQFISTKIQNAVWEPVTLQGSSVQVKLVSTLNIKTEIVEPTSSLTTEPATGTSSKLSPIAIVGIIIAVICGCCCLVLWIRNTDTPNSQGDTESVDNNAVNALSHRDIQDYAQADRRDLTINEMRHVAAMERNKQLWTRIQEMETGLKRTRAEFDNYTKGELILKRDSIILTEQERARKNNWEAMMKSYHELLRVSESM